VRLTPKISSTPNVLRPSPGHFLSAMLGRIRALRGLIFGTLSLLAALYFWSLALQRGNRSLLFPIFMTLVVASAALVAIIAHVLFFSRAKITVESGRIRKYDLIGSKTYSRQEIGRIQRLSVTSIGPPGRVAVVLTPGSGTLFVLWMAYWLEPEFEAFWRSIGVMVVGRYEDLLPYASLLTTYPPAAAGQR
jgi:hypothetical protein